ncbi:hypothetical protein [Streptomyces candidus]|uniref:Uncharacterized protein n=1 Tax=Streptomyces candidus TaxID=67283 RepID=A0A7X0LUA1_9ACTN|nr:hypothetical protein [Streptomyces candidus]MBB6440234.1 hypothetical protein [Streptomyces candidus]GHH57941.1 hypothetical protein GCM10018773_65890 [Streptomyces candidus]
MTVQDRAANGREESHARLRLVEQRGSEVNFPPIDNGLDYLLSVIASLADDEEWGRVSARDLKYAVLHLQAAAEVLLKYRLHQEHWTLVFAEPGKAKKEELADGSLASCTPAQTVDRLRRIVGLPIADKDAAALNKLAKTRNALQHYGLTDSARAVEVLDFLVRFLDEQQLLPALPDEDRQRTTQDMRTIRRGLSRIQGFVTRRMQRLRAELEPRQNRTVACPHCNQWALAVADDNSKCRFCTVRTDALDYVLHQDSNASYRRCLSCDNHAVVCGVLTAAAPDVPVDLCFSCGKTFPPLKACLRCHRRFQPHDFETVCAD